MEIVLIVLMYSPQSITALKKSGLHTQQMRMLVQLANAQSLQPLVTLKT
jgi:hypothetical protein